MELINKQDAIDVIKALPRLILDPKGEFQPVEPPTKSMIDPDDAVAAIKSMPSAQPERKTGKWIVHYECPKCGEITKDFTKYCLFCGADMRGE